MKKLKKKIWQSFLLQQFKSLVPLYHHFSVWTFPPERFFLFNNLLFTYFLQNISHSYQCDTYFQFCMPRSGISILLSIHYWWQLFNWPTYILRPYFNGLSFLIAFANSEFQFLLNFKKHKLLILFIILDCVLGIYSGWVPRVCCKCYFLINEVSPTQAFVPILLCVSQRLKHIEASAVLFFFIQYIIPQRAAGNK